MLARAGRLGTALAAGSAAATATIQIQAASPPQKLKIIVAGGHPGDAEYGCGGTIARLSQQGHEVVLLHLNDGAWPRDQGGAPSDVRRAEAAKAATLLSARVVYAGQVNGYAVLDAAHFDAFRMIVEKEKPDLLFTQWPIDQHRDHRAISSLAFDAWLQLKKKFDIYYYEVSNGDDTLQFSPTDYVDITATEPRKRAACYAHASQTPDRYYALQDQVARFRGLDRGCDRAEAFVLQLQSPQPAALSRLL
ncbi:MAG TPA: PIG-L deacetylase family protein [Terriglobia bacterium]|nr:PIG-L deacetylase family protein [Terriglobia bacterium]